MELIKKSVLGIVTCLILSNLSGIAYAEESSSIEQIYVNLPEVQVYGNNLNNSQFDAYLGMRHLQTEKTGIFEETDAPIYYYMLLDVSNSIPDTYFEAIKESICSFESTLRDKDQMVLYTFGEQVHMILNEEHQYENSAQILEKIENKDNRTMLFDAINQAADRADKVEATECQRRILMVISDGEDFTIGGTSLKETQENLSQKGLPVYAFAIADTERTNINSFGEFSRVTGGQLTVFDESQARTMLNDFHQKRMKDSYINLKTETNVVSNQMETFTLKVDDGSNLTKDVMVVRYESDLHAPILQKAELTEDGKLQISFSEMVLGADLTANYIVTCKERQETVIGVSVSSENSNVLVLSFADKLQPGIYTVRCANITDISMEKNAVANAIEFEVAQLSFGKKILQAFSNWYGMIFCVVTLVMICVVIMVYRRIKKERGVLYVDGKPVLASGIEVHRHVEIQDSNSKTFQIRIRIKNGKPEDMELQMINSFIVGRAKICNLYFDDKKMSRQHFALEWDGENMYVSDLDTTNGTLVNDVKIAKRRRLNQGDKISAGSIDMIIRW